MLWALWSFAFRGGISFWRGGVHLIRGDGRKPSRLQCAWRTLLVWVPVAGVLSLAIIAAFLAPALPLVYIAIWSLGVLLLPLYAALALLNPTRSLHDRLAGTYLVPD